MARKQATHEAWVAWVQNVTGGASARSIAKRIDRSHTTVSRWWRDSGSADAVLQIAVAYGAPVVRSLVETGWIRPDDVERMNVSDLIRRVPNTTLTTELHRRAIVYRHTTGLDNVE